MSEKILNSSFDFGTPPYIVDDWDNGVGGGDPFVLMVEPGNPDSYRIRGGSYEESISEKTYKIRQQFGVNDEAIIAKISAWGWWNAYTGDVDGYNKFIIELKKPDTSMVELLNVTKTGLIGFGQLLDEVDIKSNFDQYGNYELWLTVKTKSKRDDESTSVEEPYDSWTNSDFSLYDSNNKIKCVSNPYDENVVTAIIYKDFTINGPAHTATLTVEGKGIMEAFGCGNMARVRIRKVGVGTWSTLYDQNNIDAGVFQNWLNGIDISSYLTTAGTYRLEFYAEAQSWEEPPVGPYHQAEIHFANCALSAEWYEYTRSYGWYDDISLEMSVKKFKVVTEAIGASGKLQGVASITESEIIQMAESIKKFPKIKRFLESVGIAETYEAFAGKKAEVKEILAVLEAYLKKAKISKSESVAIAESYEILSSFNVEIKEVLQLVESYSKKVITSKAEVIGISEAILAIKQKIKNIRESVKISEFIAAKRTHGNLETTYTMGVPLEWTELEKQTTQWITKKTEINQ